jgi:hypothetical protein
LSVRKMISLRRSLLLFGLISSVVAIPQATATGSDATTTVSSAATADATAIAAAVSDSAVVDPLDIEDLFSSVIVDDDTTNSTLKSRSTKCKCYGTDNCWPSKLAFSLLNITIGGRLISYVPAAAPCHNTFNGKTTYNSAQCSVVNAGWSTEEFQYIRFGCWLISI